MATDRPMTLEQLADDYLRSARRAGNRPGSEMAYGWALKHWLRVAAERGIERPDQITVADVEAFQDYLLESGKSKQSQRVGSTAIREMLKWAAAKQLVPAELHLAVAKVRVPRGVPRPVPEEDLKRLLLYLLPLKPRMTVLEVRDRALALYLLGTSSRVSEALQVTERDWERAWVIQKGGGQQALLSPPIVVEAVRLYLARRGPVSTEFLWITHDTNRPVRRLAPEGVRGIFNRLARQVGIRHFSPHQLRHSAASVLLDRGVAVTGIADHLGHADLSTVMGYAKMSPRRRQEAVDALQGFLEDTIEEAQPKGRAKRAEPEVPAKSEQLADAEAKLKAGIPLDAAFERQYLDFLVKSVEGELTLANELTSRLAALMPGPAPSRAVPQLRIVDGPAPAFSSQLGSASGASRSMAPGSRTIDDWRDDPAAVEVRIVVSPTHGIAFEVFGDTLGIRQGFQELAALVTSNPDLPWLHA